MIKFLKTKGYEVKDPESSKENAGIDFYVPQMSSEYISEIVDTNKNSNVEIGSGFIVVPPHKDVKINLHIRALFDDNTALVGFNKSGIATKNHLVLGACVIDSSYEGEIILHLNNISDSYQNVKFGQKIAQFIPLLIAPREITIFKEEETTQEEFYKDHNSDRKEGGFGSTGV